MPTTIRIENVSKQYRLGQVGTGTISHDLNRWWARIRGKEDPYAVVGQVNQRNKAAEGDYVWALKDVTLEVEQGEVLGIIGANGSGKSTLLKLISRITSPTTGEIKAKGRIASLLEVGTGMHPEMTARENIYLNGTILGMRRYEITDKFDEIVDFAGCEMYIDTPIKRYSSGMRVRLGFAVAAFLEPDILIVDEVLAVGDAEFQNRAINKMREISKGGGGRTVLFVSHNMASVSALCTRACLLQYGKILETGSVNDVVAQYLQADRVETGGSVKFEVDETVERSDPYFLEARVVVAGNSTEQVPLNSPFNVVTKLFVPVPTERLSVAVMVSDRLGNSVFVSSSLPSVTSHPDRMLYEFWDPGTYEVNCEVPSFFLNEGRYTVTISMHRNARVCIDQYENCLSIEMQDTGEMRTEYHGPWLGVVRPRLSWQVKSA